MIISTTAIKPGIRIKLLLIISYYNLYLSNGKEYNTFNLHNFIDLRKHIIVLCCFNIL